MVSSCVENLKRKQLPTSSVTPTRLGLAEPTRKPTNARREFETMDQSGNVMGSIVVDGKYGQTHEDLIEIVRYFALGHRINGDRLEIIVDPHKTRREMAYGKSANSTEKRSTPKFSAAGAGQIENDLMKVMIELYSKTDRVSIKTKSHIVDKIKTAVDFEDDAEIKKQLTVKCRTIQKNGDKTVPTYGVRSLQMWIFSEEYTQLLGNDIPRYYDPRPLRQIDSGAVAAMARHVLTHQTMPNGGWIEVNLMKAANVTRQPSKVKNEVAASSEALRQLGIEVKNGRWYLAALAPSLATAAPALAALAPGLATAAPVWQVIQEPQVP